MMKIVTPHVGVWIETFDAEHTKVPVQSHLM